jgi:phosphoribosyl 1,2-cyclic phosphodiesterase
MKFKTIASGSTGNCYLLETEEGSLLLEAGIPIKRIKQALNFNFSNIQGCLITHEHGDHSKAVKDIAKLGIDVYSSKGTFKALGCTSHRYIPMIPKQAETIGKFEVLGFDVEHDVVEPFGYLIRHKNNKLLFVTDTYYLKYKFKNLTHIAIECNYVESKLMNLVHEGYLNAHQAARVIKSHLSLENLVEFLKVNGLSNVKELHLLHLSDGNSDINIIENEIRKIYKGNLIIAGGE